MKILGIVPARAGSKRLPGKNWKNLNGKPLIRWTLEAAMAAKGLDYLIVTTDSEECEKIAKDLGIDYIPRPEHLATDEASSYHVIQHVLEYFPQYDDSDGVCLLQPTSPFRSAVDIDHCCDIARAHGSNVRTVNVEKPTEANGAVYVGNISWLRGAKTSGIIYPFDLPGVEDFGMPAWRSLDIDTEADWMIAQNLVLSERLVP